MIVAIDPSLISCALVLGHPETAAYSSQVFTSDPADSLVARFTRYRKLVAEICDAIYAVDAEVSATFIEGYALTRNPAGATALCEFGGLLRVMLIDHFGPVYEVAPKSLKMFATGKGNASKTMVAANIAKRYGVIFDTEDEFDAYGLYRFALVAEGLAEPANAKQAEAVKAFKNPPAKRKRAAKK